MLKHRIILFYASFRRCCFEHRLINIIMYRRNPKIYSVESPKTNMPPEFKPPPHHLCLFF
ncbi:hypothetical protein HanXRQr2_Chr04g0185711 [Helianthus annuus]|uniref:Uncharacterized protein n=1 Tax=Helianthus annuus TaxID=4232 RepID=A0A9K3JCD6_HELAN|nr:hypothetical protein HanXRQr2_Chr04g0185711 [Helianthus annuus]KAJ0590667.1 hypothetical protein HanIR_Chr04g0200031 [Helianthus annuus]KAJ0762672.1 hypothetical protein HanOQP8_Chr04g0163931 [Helianthus annuus]KAJ0932929.1 hypothetical protein HanPSC8_Chr04g0179271 [Helianthus annuus]